MEREKRRRKKREEIIQILDFVALLPFFSCVFLFNLKCVFPSNISKSTSLSSILIVVRGTDPCSDWLSLRVVFGQPPRLNILWLEVRTKRGGSEDIYLLTLPQLKGRMGVAGVWVFVIAAHQVRLFCFLCTESNKGQKDVVKEIHNISQRSVLSWTIWWMKHFREPSLEIQSSVPITTSLDPSWQELLLSDWMVSWHMKGHISGSASQ